MRTIEVTISPTGETTVQTKGYSGGDCIQASKFLEQALGPKISDKRTAEYFTSDTSAQQETQQ
jgi:Protein of unknown function (DUF2997)